METYLGYLSVFSMSQV